VGGDETIQGLRQIAGGNRAAVDRFLPRLHDERRAIAARLFRRADWNSTLAPTAVVHEAYLRLGQQPRDFQRRTHFVALEGALLAKMDERQEAGP
jgi:hypothetical protein